MVRGLWVLFFNQEILWPDEKRFWAEAANLIGEGSFRWRDTFAHDMPLTALFIALPAHFGGLIAVKVSLILLSSFTVLVIMYLASLLEPGTRTMFLAGLISAFYPHFVYYSGLVLSESVFLFFLTLLFAVLLKKNEKKACSFTAGFLAGFCHLTRPTLLYFLPVFICYHMFFHEGKKLVRALLFILAFCMVISPWIIRNYQHFGTIVITTSGSGQVLWEGNNPCNKTGGVAEHDWNYNDGLPENLGELEIDRWKKKQAIDFITSSPSTFIDLAFKKIVRFWHFWPNDPQFQTWKYIAVSLASFVPVLFFALISIVTLKKQWRKTSLIWLFVLYYTMLHMVTIGSIRYRLPLEPLLIALAAASLSVIIGRIRNVFRQGTFFRII